MTAYDGSNPFEVAMKEENNNNANNATNTYNKAGSYNDPPQTQTQTQSQAAPPTTVTTTTTNTTAPSGAGRSAAPPPSGGDDCLAQIPPIIIILSLYFLGEALTIIAVIVDELDYCKFGGGDFHVRYRIFEADSSNQFEDEYYWEDCDGDSSDVSCNYAWRGLFWLVFIALNWFLMLGVIALIILKKLGKDQIQMCNECICGASRAPYMILVCGILLIIALVIWDVGNDGHPIKTSFASYDCEFEGLGGSNWCIVFAIIFILASFMYRCCAGHGAIESFDKL